MTDDEALLEMDRLYKKLYSPPLATTFAAASAPTDELVAPATNDNEPASSGTENE